MELLKIVAVLVTSMHLVMSQLNVLFINEVNNVVALEAFRSSLYYVRDKHNLKINEYIAEDYARDSENAENMLESMCLAYNQSLEDMKPPGVVLDMTRGGVPSETAKSFTRVLALPTVSASYGQEGDLRHWRNLDDEAQKYLIQVMPPGDLLPEIVRSFVKYANMTNAVIIFDNSTTVMDHKYKSLLQNVPTRHVINQIATDAEGLRKQLLKYERLEMTNYFVVGTLDTIQRALDMGSAFGYFGGKYTWHTITLDEGAVKPSGDVSFLHCKPIRRPSKEARIESLQNNYNLEARPTITAVFYFDLMVRAMLAARDMKPSLGMEQYVSCDDYNEASKPIRKNLDLLTPFKQVSGESSWGEMSMTRNGESLMKFVLTINQFESGDIVASWDAGVDVELQVYNATAFMQPGVVTFYSPSLA